MPFVAYVHARDPEPDRGDFRPAWEPNWRMWRWVAATIGLAFAAASTDGGAAALLALASFAAGCRAATAAVPYGSGLHEHRQ